LIDFSNGFQWSRMWARQAPEFQRGRIPPISATKGVQFTEFSIVVSIIDDQVCRIRTFKYRITRPIPSHHSAVAHSVSSFEGHLANWAVMGSARIGIRDGVWVDCGSVGVGFLTSNMGMFIEGVFEDRDGDLDGFSLDFLNGNLDLEGLHDCADLGDFLRHLDVNLLDVDGRDLHFIGLLDHLGVLHGAGNLLLIAFVNDLYFVGGDGRAALAIWLGRCVTRAVDESFNWHFLADLLANSLELHDSALFDLRDLTSPGHHVHDSPWLINGLLDHDSLDVRLLNWAHFNLLFHFCVLDFINNSLELRLLFVGVLVLDCLRCICNFLYFLGGATAVCLAGATASG